MRQLGEYRILRELGRGGMGVVYEAEQVPLGRRVALKVLPFAAAIDPKQRQRFQIEAQAAAQLHHPHIVPVFGVGCAHGIHYYAMQFVDGRSLAAIIAELRASRESRTEQDRAYCLNVARLGAEAADALEHAHGLGILHRDIKPANLLIDPDGALWVTDFGLARFPSDLSLTHTGDLVGTLRYMSPEQAQARGGVVDQRTDIYALGVTLYELLTLQPAFAGQDHQELLRQIALDEPVSPRRLNPAVPRDLETIILKAIAKDPSSRYTSAEELAADLRRFMDDQPILARRPGVLERTLRWAHRHRDLVATAAAILVVAMIIGTATTWAQVKKTEAEVKKTAEALRRKDAFIIEVYPLLDHSGMTEIAHATSISPSPVPMVSPEKASKLSEQALKIFQQAIELPPDNRNAREVIARAYTRLGYTRWMLSWSKATGKEPDPTLLKAAQADFRQSITLLEKLLAETPSDPKIRRYLAEALGVGGMGCCLVSAFRPDEAEPLYRRTIEIRRELLRGEGNSGDSAAGQTQADEIGEQMDLSYLVSTVQIVSGMLDARGNSAEANSLRRQLDDDVAALAARLSKPEFQIRRQLLAAQLLRGQFTADRNGRRDAVTSYRRALMLDPQNAHATNNLAWSITSVPDDPWFDPAQGLRLARKAVALEPGSWSFLNTLGVAAFRARDWKTATEVLQRSITFTGGDAHDFFFLAMASWQQGRKHEALTFFDQAVAWTDKHKPADPELRRFRAEAAAMLGKARTKPKPEKPGCEKKGGPIDTAQKTAPSLQAGRG